MIESLQSIELWAEVWAASLWRASWQGGIALAIAWAIARWCTFLSPRVVCWVWRLACLKLLVTLLWVEPVSLALLPAKLPDTVNIATAPATPTGSETALDVPPVGRVAPVISQPEQAPQAIGAWSLLALLWLAGAAYRVAVSARQWSFVSQLLRSPLRTPSSLLQCFFAQEAERLNVRRTPQLCVSPRADGPFLAGIWRPAVVLPDRAEEEFDESELRLMLAHELAHFKRRDLGWNWLPTVVWWLFYFHPLVWLMIRRWSEAQEAACDEVLIQRRVARPVDYGRLLVKVATRWPCEPGSVLAVAGVLGACSNLERRILTMAQVQPFSAVRLMIAAAFVALIGLAGVIPWQLVAQDIHPATAVDAKAIQGTWIVYKLDQVDHEPSEEERAAWRSGKFKLVIAGDTITFWDNGGHWNYTLDATKLPKRMEIRIQEKGNEIKAPAIYDLQGDVLRICQGREGDREPPAHFDVKKAAPGKFPTCWNLRRQTRANPSNTSFLIDALKSVGRGSDPSATVGDAVAQADPKQAAAVEAKARTDATRQLKRLGIAMHNYHDTHKRFPPPFSVDAAGAPLLSWRVLLLSYLEDPDARPLYEQFHVDEPWDSAHNKSLIAKMPDIYRCSGAKKPAAGMTVYLAAVGDSTSFPRSGVVNVRKITDGTARTIAIVEADDDHAVPWTKPEDWNFNPQHPSVGLGGHFTNVFLTLFCDGSVHALPNAVDRDVLRKLFTRNGREPVDIPE